MVVPRNPWMVVGAVLGGLIVVATMASDSVWRSLLGAPLRLDGMLAWLSFAVAFVVGLSLRRQHSGAVAESLVLVGPVACVAAARSGKWRWAGWLACCLVLVNLVVSQTRTVLVVAVVTGIVVGLLRLRGRLRWFVVALALAAVAGASLTDRWQQVEHDLEGRIAIWKVAVSAIADAPLLGSGSEMFIVSYGEHVSDGTVREFGREVAVDRAHSGVLDFATSFGAVAGVLYVAVLLFVGLLAVRAIRSGDWFQAALAAGIAAYSLQQ